ncbi:hypothetical protein [Bordetella sp. BOR01]|uniref:hypothetical protein n=1 Tax=Bordetella sp. BOR01 TaxID=2854779 RepID=UPI001C4690E6|nr:hypothetical protein [Bordetella sp. BOR01]MBV7485187.1 hypothetical protein [Bordetella sp. BOR01]
MTIDPVTHSLSSTIALDAFSKAAQAGGDVYISIDGQALQVLGTGTTASGRSVAWVAPNIDITSMFSQALANTYGNGIANAVSRELGLTATPGKPLSARVITQALDMAQTSRQALEGVDFATRLASSASMNSPLFLDACARAGVPADSLTAAQRQHIDSAMQRRFDDAASSGQTPVAHDTVRGWLAELLTRPS